VNERTEQKYPVYLAGVSMGASTVLMTAGLELPENVKGVIADCGFTSAYDEWRYVVKDNMKLSYGLRGLMIDRICQKKINTNSKNITTITAMRKTQLPILFIHGTDDKFVPVRMTYENYKSCNAPKELLIVPGAIHGQSYYLEKEKYEVVTKKFWEKYN
ncbi:MAG: alpha/beta hydrolase, partial [Clostridia bacterium]|nr:alpha/beta hydrolase [Clostridia bacterium]